jgi:hypothetical protein
MRIIKIAAVVTALALAPSPAAAAAMGECVSSYFTAEADAEIARDYLASGTDALERAHMPDVGTVAGACLPKDKGRTLEDTLRITSVMTGHWLKVGAGAAIVQRHKLSAAQLDAAWKGLPAVHRARFSRVGRADAQSTEAMIAFIHAARPDIPDAKLRLLRADDAARPSAEIKPLVGLIKDFTAYGIGRGMVESPELIDVSLPDSASH